MTKPYRLHFAPDNASLVIRLALEEMQLPYQTVLVDRTKAMQRSADYLALNPNGLIPVLETPDGPMFETGAILLWLSDRHNALAPAIGSRNRVPYLKWLFSVSNTLHADLRLLFYPHLYIGDDAASQAKLQHGLQARLRHHLAVLDEVASAEPKWLRPEQPTGLCYYLACLLRWTALYPKAMDHSWFDLTALPHLHRLCEGLEPRPAVVAAQASEGLGPTPFTAPAYAAPPEGSAT